MNAFYKGYIDRLKEHVIERFSMNSAKSILSSDCYKLSFEIQEKTSKRVSETTLKRFFGFTSCAHNPSQYTLNAICNYCDFPNWEYFKEQMEIQIANNFVNREWQEVKMQLTELSMSTLSLARKKINNWDLPNQDTPPLNKCMTRFHQAKENLMMIHAPAFSGKTETAVRWAEEIINSSSNNILLYLDSLSIFESAVYGYHAHRWLANVLDFPTASLLTEFISHYQKDPPGWIHIVIDGFNEETLSENQYYAVLQNLLEMIAELEDYPWIKFTLVIRTNIFEKLKRRTSKKLQSSWHMNKFGCMNGVFAYNTKKISQLLHFHDIDHSLAKISASANADWLSIPRFFQWFLAQKNTGLFEGLGNEMLQYIYIHDLFTHNSVFFKTMEQTNRSLLLEFILSIPCMDEYKRQEHGRSLSRSKILTFQGLDLYHELVGNGILSVDHESSGNLFDFSFPQYQAYLFAYYLYHILEMREQDAFMRELDKHFDHFPTLRGMAATCYILFSMEDIGQSGNRLDMEGFGDKRSLGHILMSRAAFSHWLYLQGSTGFQDKIRQNIIETQLISDLIYRAHLPYTDLKDSLLHILQLALEPAQEYQLRVKLATFALLKWDEDEVIKQLELLTKLEQQHPLSWSVNAIEGLALLYHFIRYKKVNIKDIGRIINTDFVPPTEKSLNEDVFSFELVGYLTIILSQDPTLARKYLRTIDYKIKSLEEKNSITYVIYYFLRQLIQIRATGKLPALPDPVHTEFVKAKNPQEYTGILVVFGQILALHFELATSRDHTEHYRRSQEIEDMIKPLKYGVLTKYFALFYYANRASSKAMKV